LLEQLGVAAQAVHRGDDALAEEVPEQDAGQGIDRIVGNGKAEEVAEDHLEHQHHEERLQHRPQEADRRAAVAHLELALHEGEDEVAIAEEVEHRSEAGAAASEGLFYTSGGGSASAPPPVSSLG